MNPMYPMSEVDELDELDDVFEARPADGTNGRTRPAGAESNGPKVAPTSQEPPPVPEAPIAHEPVQTLTRDEIHQQLAVSPSELARVQPESSDRSADVLPEKETADVPPENALSGLASDYLRALRTFVRDAPEGGKPPLTHAGTDLTGYVPVAREAQPEAPAMEPPSNDPAPDDPGPDEWLAHDADALPPVVVEEPTGESDVPTAVTPRAKRARRFTLPKSLTSRQRPAAPLPIPTPGTLEARNVSAWFGDHKVLDQVSLTMPAGTVTALIGPSGCGKSTFIRILNRMHELVTTASLSGEVLLDGADIYGTEEQPTLTRRRIGMVFQKPNPFPAMTVYDNVLAGLKLTGTKVRNGDDLVEESLRRASLWDEVRNRLRAPGGALSGGQQQRLCIARSLAVRPDILLMDEPCSALDPTSTRRIEETIADIAQDVTIVIVTHNMQQAARVSQQCAFFLAAENEPGHIVEVGPTEMMFGNPSDPRTADYVHGRFG